MEEQTTGPLPETGLLGLKGKSGAGKSSVILALSFALGYCPFPATALQSFEHLTNEKLQIRLDLIAEGEEVSILRGETTSFNGLKGAKNLDGEIKKLVKLPLDLVEVLTFREQKSHSKFLTLPDAKKKEFLSKLLGLEELEEQTNEALRNIKEEKDIF